MIRVGKQNKPILFISDLHLCRTRPQITRLFLDFLSSLPRETDALYILGDLFEYWAGDDDIDDALNTTIAEHFLNLAKTGTQIFLMHGNRDFLISDSFSQRAGITILKDPSLIVSHGKRILLSHGDSLCTDDVAYQAFRQQVRSPSWQAAFLSQSLASRKALIEKLREQSEIEKSNKSESIMDVNSEAVSEMIREFGHPDVLIHGHTHRPGQHRIQKDGHMTERWVLGDWYEQGSCIRLDENGLKALPIRADRQSLP